MKVEYETNNSGGRWWLKDEDWKALEEAGWDVEWMEERWHGCLARRATKYNCSSIRDAAAEWERVTGESPMEAGCSCCGQPHTFYLYDDNEKEIARGPEPTNKCAW